MSRVLLTWFSGETVRVPRLVLMNSNEKENIMSAYAGDIVAMIGII